MAKKGRPEPPEGGIEDVAKRGPRHKEWDLGNGVRQRAHSVQEIHAPSDFTKYDQEVGETKDPSKYTGGWDDLDEGLEKSGEIWGTRSTYYTCAIRQSVMAYDYTSKRTGATFRMELTMIDGVVPLVPNTIVTENEIGWRNVTPGLTVSIRCTPTRVAFRINVDSEVNQKTLTFHVTSGAMRGMRFSPEMSGKDNATRVDTPQRDPYKKQRTLEIESVETNRIVNGDGEDEYDLTFTVTGNAFGRDPKNGVEKLMRGIIYPVEYYGN